MHVRLSLPILPRWLVFALLAICLLWQPQEAAANFQEKPKNILLLNSYHVGYLWNVKLLAGMHDVLNRADIPLRLRYEFMDAKHYTSDAFVGELRSLYRQKYRNMRFDVIIASDNDAFNFLRRFRDEIFPDTPVVFCGVNNFQMSWLDNFINATGIGEYFDLEGTMELALDLVPTARNMVIIGGVDTSSRMNYEMAKALMPKFQHRVDFIDLYGLNPDELAAELAKVPRDSVLLYIAYYLTPDGSRLTVQESVDFVARNSGLPMFSAWSYLMEEGMVGGKMIYAEEQGRIAAQMALQIAKGEPVEALPVRPSVPTYYMFDYPMLRKFNISTSLLPPDSIILNMEQNIFERNKPLVLALGGFILYQFIVIVGLLISNRRRKRAERKLRHEEAQLEILLELSRMGSSSVADLLGHALPRIASQLDALVGLLYVRIAHSDEVHVARWEKQRITYLTNEDARALPGISTLEGLLLAGPINGVSPPISIWSDFDSRVWNHIAATEILPERATLFFALAEKGEGFSDEDIRNLSLFGFELMRLIRLRLDEALQQELENKLLHSQKMEALGTFTSSIAHDFNNILESIASCCELALDEMPAELSNPRGDVRQALRSSQRGKALIRRLLDFSRKEPSRVRPVSVAQLAEECMDMIRPLLPVGIEATTRIEQTPVVLGDPDKLALVIINLLTNSIRAMGEAGTLQLKVCLPPNGQNLPAEVLLEVQDTGCGIPDDVLEHIFEPFFTTRPKGEGTGLGLSLVDGIVRSHGGTISVSSQLDRGTTFSVRLPLASEAELEVQDTTRSDLPIGGDEHILIVDDDKDVARALGRKLEQLGYVVTLAFSGPDALETYGDGGLFALVLTDYEMPGMNGLELGRELQGITMGLPVILVTGYDRKRITDNKKTLLASGVRTVIQKPVNHNQLARTIRASLDDSLPM